MLPVNVLAPVSASRLPAGPGWAYEPKWDGYRAAVIHVGQVQIVSRRGTDLTEMFPDLAAAVAEQVPDGTMLDGELVVLRDGRLSFDALQQRMARGSRRATRLAQDELASLVVFDLLLDQGVDVRPLSWDDRRARLETVGAGWVPPVQLTPYTTDHATATDWLHSMVAMGIEGIVSKRRSSPYGVRGSWSKTKFRETLTGVVGATIGPLDRPEALIIARTDPGNDTNRSSDPAESISEPDGGGLVVLGRTTALTPAQSTEVGQLLRPPVGPHPWPAVMGAGHFGGDPVPITHADPQVIVEVSADAAEQNGRRRHPLRFLRVRHDT